MNNIVAIMAGALGIVLIAFLIIVVSPHLQLEEATKYSSPNSLTASEQRGRDLYVSLNCHACHTQQVRDDIWSNDSARGWGRPSESNDYIGQNPHLLGTMRTGPDLTNVGERQPSEVWHLIHLYQPRAVVPESNMPAYPFLFDLINEGDQIPFEQKAIQLPQNFIPSGKTVITTKSATDLVNYLKSLKQK